MISIAIAIAISQCEWIPIHWTHLESESDTEPCFGNQRKKCEIIALKILEKVLLPNLIQLPLTEYISGRLLFFILFYFIIFYFLGVQSLIWDQRTTIWLWGRWYSSFKFWADFVFHGLLIIFSIIHFRFNPGTLARRCGWKWWKEAWDRVHFIAQLLYWTQVLTELRKTGKYGYWLIC